VEKNVQGILTHVNQFLLKLPTFFLQTSADKPSILPIAPHSRFVINLATGSNDMTKKSTFSQQKVNYFAITVWTNYFRIDPRFPV